jgi:hypothetical protein
MHRYLDVSIWPSAVRQLYLALGEVEAALEEATGHGEADRGSLATPELATVGYDRGRPRQHRTVAGHDDGAKPRMVAIRPTFWLT